jgi:two-component system CheB/CheR fusion protein
LIYLEPVLQNKVISLFHYAARPQGFLVLGTSEGIGSATGLFAAVDLTRKIFSKKSTASRQIVSFSLDHTPERRVNPIRLAAKQMDSTGNYLEVQKEFDRRALNQYSPPTVFVNDDLEIFTRAAP